MITLKNLKTLIFALLIANVSFSQNSKINTDTAHELSLTDIKEAIELIDGKRIHKYSINNSNQEKDIVILYEKFTNGVISEIDTVLFLPKPYNLEVDDFKIITKTSDDQFNIAVKGELFETLKKPYTLEKFDERQEYFWREYDNNTFQEEGKIPLLIIASSWFDQKINRFRFCGVVKLKEGDKDTIELLSKSPSYAKISYVAN